MSKRLRKQRNIGVEKLSADCWQLVFNHLNQQDELKTVSLVCKDFLTNSNLVKQSLKVIHPEVSMLSKNLKRFTRLKSIDLSNFHGTDLDETIREVAHSDQSCLEALHCPKGDREAIQSVITELCSSPKTKNIKTLVLKDHVRDEDLEVIANSFPNLEELGIGDFYPKCWLDPELQCLPINLAVPKLKLLKKINLCGHNKIPDQALDALSKNCLYLKDVTIANHGGTVTGNGIGHLLRNRPNLEALKISSINMQRELHSSAVTIENSISYTKALTCLTFMHMDISDKLLQEVAKAKLQLKDFGLCSCKNFTALGLCMVSNSNYLNKLQLKDSSIFDADLRLFLKGDVENLSHIEIWGCRVTNSTFFLLLNKCPSLVEIKMSEARLSTTELNNIQLSKKHSNIREIHFTNSLISDELLKQLALSFPKLNVLSLDICNDYTSKGIEAILTSCKFMRKLIINCEAYYNVRLRVIEVENLELSLELLTLTDAAIDDKSVAEIAEKCPRLTSLDLSVSWNLTTMGIKRLVENVKTLTYLNVVDCCSVNCGELLDWMLSTGSFASLKKIGIEHFTGKHRDEFLRHGCLLSKHR